MFLKQKNTTSMIVSLALVFLSLIDAVTAGGKADATPTKYLIFREDCYEAFFARGDFTSDPTCMKFTTSKFIGYAIVLGATIYKLP